MLVLAIDTSGTGCSAAVYDGRAEEVLARAGAEIGRGHAERLMDFVDEALIAADRQLADIERIAVTIGPGSFTGIRVGVAAARGLALALASRRSASRRFRSSPKARGSKSPAGLCSPSSTQNGTRSMFSRSTPAAGPRARRRSCPPARRTNAFPAFPASSRVQAPIWSPPRGRGKPDEIDIGVVGRLGAVADPAAAKPKPLYLRGPDAKPQAGFAVTRA